MSRSTRARDRKSTRLNSSHVEISYAVFCLKKKTAPRSRTRIGASKGCGIIRKTIAVCISRIGPCQPPLAIQRSMNSRLPQVASIDFRLSSFGVASLISRLTLLAAQDELYQPHYSPAGTDVNAFLESSD